MWDLRAARKQKGLTQAQAASALGVTQAYLSMLENKQRPVPTGQLSRVVEVYGLSYSTLPMQGAHSWYNPSLRAGTMVTISSIASQS